MSSALTPPDSKLHAPHYFQTSRKSNCQQHQPLADQYQLILKLVPRPFNIEGSTDMKTSPFCPWRCPGHSEILLLLGRLSLGPQWFPSSQFQPCLPRPSPCSDLRQVNIHHPYPADWTLYWVTDIGSVPISRWILHRQVQTLPDASTQVGIQH